MTEDVIPQRGKTYGTFASNAAISQATKDLWRNTPNWSRLKPHQREALEMTALKVARILNGNPDHIDSWVDGAGYLTLGAGPHQ